MLATILTIVGSLLGIFATWYGGKFVSFILNKWNEYQSQKKLKQNEEEIADYVSKQAEKNKKLKDLIDASTDTTIPKD